MLYNQRNTILNEPSIQMMEDPLEPLAATKQEREAGMGESL